MFKKYHLGDYRWVTYEDADATAEYVGRGLRTLGLANGMKVCMFADTRSEWMLTAQACFKQGFPNKGQSAKSAVRRVFGNP